MYSRSVGFAINVYRRKLLLEDSVLHNGNHLYHMLRLRSFFLCQQPIFFLRFRKIRVSKSP